jgi:hypothetical protein
VVEEPVTPARGAKVAELGIELIESVGKNAGADGDRLQDQHGDAMLDYGCHRLDADSVDLASHGHGPSRTRLPGTSAIKA